MLAGFRFDSVFTLCSSSFKGCALTTGQSAAELKGVALEKFFPPCHDKPIIDFFFGILDVASVMNRKFREEKSAFKTSKNSYSVYMESPGCDCLVFLKRPSSITRFEIDTVRRSREIDTVRSTRLVEVEKSTRFGLSREIDTVR